MPDLGVIYCAAIPILIISAGMFLSNIFFTLRAEKTTGTVVGYKSSRSNKGGVTYAEVVEFQGQDGQTVQFTEKLYRSRFTFPEGQIVNVLYDPDKPARARVNKFSTLYMVPILLAVIGVGLIIFNLPMFSGLTKTLLDFLMNLLDKLPL